ncbi:alpha-L-fucosidase, partial [candidate division KSB1 bacterium]|nr:alpha-L-fucosidase [candidate division KSB1 bacterium]
DWETCMTMNDHWGYNKNDHNWKSAEELIRKLADIASKGGNFLLNVGPKADGTFPQESIDRLKTMGDWMRMNGESIYGTQASPFKQLDWGRCTQKAIGGDTRLYLHVFDWPDGKLVVPGIYNEVKEAALLADPNRRLSVNRVEDALVIDIPAETPDTVDAVILLDIKGAPDINEPPAIEAAQDIFIDKIDINIIKKSPNAEVRYTLDGSEPTASSPLADSPITVTQTTTVRARCFRDGQPASSVTSRTVTKVAPAPPIKESPTGPGIAYKYYQGEWDDMPVFAALEAVKSGTLADFSLENKESDDHFAFEFYGYVNIPQDGVYTFYTTSDDGSQLFINEQLIVDNGGVHGMQEKDGVVALGKGAHRIRVTFFERDGSDELHVGIAGPGLPKGPLPKTMLFID